MNNRVSILCIAAFLALLACARSPAQQPADHPNPDSSAAFTEAPPEEAVVPEGEVVIDGRPILTVYETIAGSTPQERARVIESRIVSVARDSHYADSIRLEPREGWTEIFAGDAVIMVVTEADARETGETREKLSADYGQKITQAIANYRHDHSWRMLLNGFLKAILATAILIPLLWLIGRVGSALRFRIERYVFAIEQEVAKSAWQISVAYIGPITLAAGAVFKWLLILAVVEIYLTVTLGFFSSTRQISMTVTKWTLSQLEALGKSALDYLPNLLVLAAIALIANYVIRLIRLVFGEIGKGNLKIRGFYPDWADPTEKLFRALVFVLTLVVAFPYLPGAKSPAFQGISIFVGLLLSFGSSSAVANAVAGVILTYMRSFLIGDWVQIGDTMGEVTEKNLLVTRVLTPKEEVITIPNATVMNVAVKNYSVEARKSGVIFHTTVSIGYDEPWQTVHQLLIDAALATDRVLQHPAPFVLQSALNDFYVSYELNAYTDSPREVLNIFSGLHRNIQDKFNEAGVEICSPHFAALRDGNAVARPGQYLKPGYKPTGFRVDVTEAGSKHDRSSSPGGDR
ncbi:MAG TPA: mechanosensitive ion channel family protein [Terriglobales bacterium]